MKLRFSIFFTFLALVLITSACRRKGGVLACSADSLKYSENFSAFAADQTRGNCEAVKKSIEQLYKSCTYFTAVDKQEYEDFKNDFDCTQYN